MSTSAKRAIIDTAEGMKRDEDLKKCVKEGKVYTDKQELKDSRIKDGRNIFSKLYYRYTLMTGVYMLDTTERVCLHCLYLFMFIFWYKYLSGFFFEIFKR